MKIGAEKGQRETKEQTAHLTTGPTRSSWVQPLSQGAGLSGAGRAAAGRAPRPCLSVPHGAGEAIRAAEQSWHQENRENPGTNKHLVLTHERSLPGQGRGHVNGGVL